MKLNGEKLKITVQKTGRLGEPSRQLLKSIGLDFESDEGRLFSPCVNFPTGHPFSA